MVTSLFAGSPSCSCWSLSFCIAFKYLFIMFRLKWKNHKLKTLNIIGSLLFFALIILFIFNFFLFLKTEIQKQKQTIRTNYASGRGLSFGQEWKRSSRERVYHSAKNLRTAVCCCIVLLFLLFVRPQSAVSQTEHWAVSLLNRCCSPISHTSARQSKAEHEQAKAWEEENEKIQFIIPCLSLIKNDSKLIPFI